MATLDSVSMMRTNLAFIEVTRLPGLGGLGCHARSSFAASVLQGTRKPTRLMVGRLHYSLRLTLSAHFRCGIGASERLNVTS